MTSDVTANDPLPTLHGLLIRPALDRDSAAAAALVARIWSDYPGCVFDADEEDDLRAIASHYAAKGGAFWVVEDGQGQLVATVAIAPTPMATGMVLHRLYVERAARRQGLASRLLEFAEGAARRRGAGFVELWSDTRFTEAHAFYARHGYVLMPGERALRDASDSYEFHFRKRL